MIRKRLKSSLKDWRSIGSSQLVVFCKTPPTNRSTFFSDYPSNLFLNHCRVDLANLYPSFSKLFIKVPKSYGVSFAIFLNLEVLSPLRYASLWSQLYLRLGIDYICCAGRVILYNNGELDSVEGSGVFLPSAEGLLSSAVTVPLRAVRGINSILDAVLVGVIQRRGE